MMNNELSKPSLVGKTLYAKGGEDNLDGTFEALITISGGKYTYTCRLYGHKIDSIPFDIENASLLLECIEYDDNGILLVKILG